MQDAGLTARNAVRLSYKWGPVGKTGGGIWTSNEKKHSLRPVLRNSCVLQSIAATRPPPPAPNSLPCPSAPPAVANGPSLRTGNGRRRPSACIVTTALPPPAQRAWCRGSAQAAGAACGLGIFRMKDFVQGGLVLDGPPNARLRIHHSRRLGLTHSLPRIGLYRFGHRESGWLAFRHGNDEYGREGGCLASSSHLPAKRTVPTSILFAAARNGVRR